jgi:hypothetical protein
VMPTADDGPTLFVAGTMARWERCRRFREDA